MKAELSFWELIRPAFELEEVMRESLVKEASGVEFLLPLFFIL